MHPLVDCRKLSHACMKIGVVNGITTGYEWNSCTKMNIHAIRMENRSFCSQ